MPEETQKKSSEELIDVGETVGAEVNLDDKGEPEKVEAPKVEKIEVEQVPEDKSFENKRKTFPEMICFSGQPLDRSWIPESHWTGPGVFF